jgi:hypothetical protein
LTIEATWENVKDFRPNYICGARARFDLTEKGNDATGVTGSRVKTCEYANQEDYTNLVTSNYGEWKSTIEPS